MLTLDADLDFAVQVPGAKRVTGRLTGSGTALQLTVSDPFVFAGRNDASAVRGVADALAERGLTVTVVTCSVPFSFQVARGAPAPVSRGTSTDMSMKR